MEQPVWMLYPTLEPSEIGLLANVNLPENYRELVPKFYKKNRKKDVEKYSEELLINIKDAFPRAARELEVILLWDNNFGLKNIKLDIHGGFDFEPEDTPPRFTMHNLSTLTSIVGFAIATKYVSELLKSE